MNSRTDETEYWQRVACKLAWILSWNLTEDADEFLWLASEVETLKQTMTDAEWDCTVHTNRMEALVPDEVEALMALPMQIRHADVRR